MHTGCLLIAMAPVWGLCDICNISTLLMYFFSDIQIARIKYGWVQAHQSYLPLLSYMMCGANSMVAMDCVQILVVKRQMNDKYMCKVTLTDTSSVQKLCPDSVEIYIFSKINLICVVLVFYFLHNYNGIS